MRSLISISIFSLLSLILTQSTSSVQILSKSKLQKCEKVSQQDSSNLNCTSKIVINLAVPSESSGREASIVAQLVEVEEEGNSSNTNMRTLRVPPVITVNKSAAYASYELTYIRDVSYKPEELYVKTRKCEPDAGADVVKQCERLRDDQGHIIEHTQPTCCPCGNERRVPSSCGNFFDKLVKGKANTAHCLRFPGDWFHVFGIGQRSLGFSVRIQVKTGSTISEVIVGPNNRTAISNDKFLRANLIGDYVGYTNIPSFDDFYLVIPRQGGPGQPKSLGTNFTMWMLLERVRFTLDGLECNKIGVSFEAFNGQPGFCSAPLWSCLHNQLWNFWDTDQNRISRKQVPLYCVEGRFERINQHPNAGSRSFSIGITEVLNTNLLIELTADDIEYVYQRSPGKIVSITVPTFEALTQFGAATITTKNIGEVEASYSLTFDCSAGVSQIEEQFYIMKPKEILTRSFKIYPTSDQASKYVCAAILKDSDFSEVDRAECQFTTTSTNIDNGSQIAFQPPKSGIKGFFESIEIFWKSLWDGMTDFITGKTCRQKCYGFFDFSCHIQYICISWLLMFGLFLAIFPTVLLLVWLLHEKGLFDPFYDWWEDHFLDAEDIHRHRGAAHLSQVHVKKHHKHDVRHHQVDMKRKHKSIDGDHKHKPLEHTTDHRHHLHHGHKDKHKHHRTRNSSLIKQTPLDRRLDDTVGHQRHGKERESVERLYNIPRHTDEIEEELHKHKHMMDGTQSKFHSQRNY
ncbi:HAP2-GCS1 domain-containing protein [Heracleum sosnowskyi]|uniref:HAP2-GCS1 domain-containing protein n=1 Tax=Heracleum sosnowskyi TaxID=360622 RepID=A0AAD8HYV1_9APIA|nr:HAP2-GCS1 domain-containing protein [Heracleum sosnowskyi]